jgi:hypothetical protein
MKKILMSLAVATTALTAAAPASAQWGQQRGHYGYPGDRGLVNRFHQQLAQIDQRIERSAQRRAISAGEYRALRNHSRELRQRLQRFAYNGLTRGEAQDISDRIDNLRDRLRDERRDGRRDGW